MIGLCSIKDLFFTVFLMTIFVSRNGHCCFLLILIHVVNIEQLTFFRLRLAVLSVLAMLH